MESVEIPTYEELRNALLRIELQVRSINESLYARKTANEITSDGADDNYEHSITQSYIDGDDKGKNASNDLLVSELRTLLEQCDFALSDKEEREENDITTTEADAEACEDRVRELEEELRANTSTRIAEDMLTSIPPRRQALCETILTEMSELHAHLEVASCVFKFILSKSVHELCNAKCCAADIHFAEPSVWHAHESYLLKLMNELTRKTTLLYSSSTNTTTTTTANNISVTELIMLRNMQEELTEVQDLAIAAMAHIERSRKLQDTRERRIDDFITECNKLIIWCRQQQANLDAMREPDHIQEYCGSLVENYAAMSQNFNILLCNVKELVYSHNTRVCDVLTEANELWLYLQVTAFERLARTLYEIHPSSPLEVETNKYAYTPHRLVHFMNEASAFVESAQSVFQSIEAKLTSDDNVSLIMEGNLRSTFMPELPEEDIKRLHECFQTENDLATSINDTELQDLLKRYEKLPDEIKEFALKAGILREAYACLREAVLIRVTFLVPTNDLVKRSVERQREIGECVTKLTEWAKKAAQGESWRDIYDKIVEIRKLIKSEQEQLRVLSKEL